MGVMRNALRILFAAAWMMIADLGWAQEERVHTVQRKETVYGIARQYGVDLNRLFDLNRWAEEGISKGDVLRVPSASDGGENGQPQVPESPLNLPHEDEGIPTASATSVASEEITTQEVLKARPVPAHWPGDTIRIAVMLPFSAGQDSLERQATRLRDIALDCASGVRLALDSGRWLGANLDVRFLDTGRDTAGAMLCGPEDLQFNGHDVDIAVGPLKRNAMKQVRSWPGMADAVHLALTDLGSPLVMGAPGLLYPYSQRESTMALLAEHIALGHPGERVMMLATGDIRNIQAEDAFRSGWNKVEKDSLTTLVEVQVTARGLGSLRDSLSDVRRNILVAPGGKASRSFAGVLQTEIQLGDTMDFLLYADGSWLDFEFLDPLLRDRVRMTVVDGTGSRADSSAQGQIGDSLFMARSRRMAVLRGADVGQYGWLSHDLLRNALLWTAGHGRSWPARLAAGKPLLMPRRDSGSVLYRFAWGAPFGEGSGLVNKAARLLRQEDLRWIEIDLDD